MAIATTTFAPQIDYDSGSNFVFSTNNMYVRTAPSVDSNFNWDTAIIPGQDGGAAYGGDKAPRMLSLQFEYVTASLDPDAFQTALGNLETALQGRGSATATWPRRSFHLYYHLDGSDVLYLKECICISLKVARKQDYFFKGAGVYPIIDLVIQANDPDYQTGAAGGSGDTIDGPVTIDVPAGTDAVQGYNTTDGENKFVIESDGTIKTKGEVYELQTSV